LDAEGKFSGSNCVCLVLILFPWYLPVAGALDFFLGVGFQSIYYVNQVSFQEGQRTKETMGKTNDGE